MTFNDEMTFNDVMTNKAVLSPARMKTFNPDFRILPASASFYLQFTKQISL